MAGIVSVGAITAVIRMASPILTGAGTCALPVSGAVASSARMRANGHSIRASQPLSCKEVRVITGGGSLRLNRSASGFA